MKQAKLLFLLIAALAFASCRPTARQAVADAEQPTDSTEAATSADTLRLVIIDKSISRIVSTVAAHDSATVYAHIGLFHLAPGHYRLTKQIDGRTLSDDFYIPSNITFPTPVYR